MMSLAPSQLGYSEAQAERFFERVAEQARLVPGVQSAALTRFMPMDGLPPSVTMIPEGFQFPAGQESATLASSIVDEHYFDTIGLPILKGRGFRATDSAGAPKVAVVNEVVAQRYWPGQDPIGKRFRLDNSAGPWVEIVGVAKTSKYSFIIERPTRVCLSPLPAASTRNRCSCWFESLGDPTSLVTPLREVVRGLDANLPISNTRTMEELYRLRSVVILNVIVSLIASMGMMGLALALVGSLRPGGVCGQPADQGDRDPHGDRRRPLRRPADGAAAGHGARDRRARRRSAGERWRGPRSAQPSFPAVPAATAEPISCRS